MAPTLMGPHTAAVCGDCGFRFTYGDEHPPGDGWTVCPNCGFRQNETAGIERIAGDRIVVDRWATGDGPRRFQMIAFQDAARSGRLTVKRVVGLPGETLTIQDGELFADGKLVRKSLAQLRQMRVLVHDDRFRPKGQPGRSPLPDRWTDRSLHGWRTTGVGYSIERSRPGSSGDGRADKEPFHWLAYHHWPCYAGPQKRTTVRAVDDGDAYNQGLPRRRLHSTADVQIACRIQSQGEGRLALAAHDRGRRILLQIDIASGSCRVAAPRLGTEVPLPGDLAAKLAHGQPVACEFGLFDRQVFLELDGLLVLLRPYASPPGSSSQGTRSIEIGAWRQSVTVSQLRVYRDVHYVGPDDAARWSVGAADRGLESQSFLVLGDNPPLSEDSRQRGEGVHRGAIEGIVKKW